MSTPEERIWQEIQKIQALKKAGFVEAPEDHVCEKCDSQLMVSTPANILDQDGNPLVIYSCPHCGWSNQT